jgi:hypothetical protein
METQQIMEMLNSMQEKAEADRKADREAIKEMMDANQEQMMARMDISQAKADVNLNEI